MKCGVVLTMLVFVQGANEAVTASGRLDGKKVTFPETSIPGGVKATVALLESCHDTSPGTADELKKALERNHIRLTFAKPVTVKVGDEKLEVSDLVFTQPLNTGVFWLKVGDKVVRCTKYEFAKEKDFVAWRDQAVEK